MKYLLHEKRLSVHTHKAYQTDLNQFAQYILQVFFTEDLRKVNFREIRAWIVSLKEDELDHNSINRKIATLKAFYRFMQKKGFVEANPMRKISSLKKSSKPPVFVSEKAIDGLLKHEYVFDQSFEGLRDQLIIELLYGTGLRLSELIELKVNDVDLFSAKITVLGKRNKTRIIPLHKRLEKELEAYLAEREGQVSAAFAFLFFTDRKAKLYPVWVQRLTKKYLGLVDTKEKRSPHVLRHTFATHLLNRGAELNAIKELLGHSSLTATQIYTHNSIEKLKAVHSKAHPKAE
ncbi:tyrosine-type recombinase/integrase [Marinilongibacter aquaticus]|uniref:tyrosine-type recombinase/integrase n=1 Tax=Marinilongibacter aquaticus TaxID=2975157 RepID=UPI00286E1447|nr:tyrosine-type recombinase/integrase [Marinilongibacter aquaticus]